MTRTPGELRFSGSSADGDRPSSPQLLNIATVEIALSKYCTVHVASGPVLPRREQLLSFHTADYMADLRAEWLSAPVVGGLSLRELYVGGLLAFRDYPEMFVSTGFEEQPLGADIMPEIKDPEELVRVTMARLRANATPATAAMFDERHAHVVTLSGADTQSSRVKFHDSWPGASLFSAEIGSSAGAVRDPDDDEAWWITAEALSRVLVAVIWPPSTTRKNLAHALDRTDSYLDVAIRWVSNFPGSRLAITTAANCFAELLETRGHDREALHWWRQAAVVGDLGAAERLADRLIPTSVEARYWRELCALSKTGCNPWEMPAETIPTEDQVRFRKQGAEVSAGDELGVALELASTGRHAEAKRKLVHVREVGNILEASAASFFIGLIWLNLGQPLLAVPPLAVAATSSNLPLIGPACAALGDAYSATEQLDRSRQAFERGAFSGNEQTAPYSAIKVAEILAVADGRAARPYFEYAAAGSDPDVSRAAREQLQS